MSTIVICEKQNAAKRIAEILSKGEARRNYIHRVPVFIFQLDAEEYTVIGLRGHILELDYPEDYQRWHRIKPSELIHIMPAKKIFRRGRNIVSALKELARKVDNVIIATDYDREGELIGVEALEVIEPVNPKLRFKRVRFSALTRSEVQNAFDNLMDIDYNLSASAESRQIVDLAWGASLTRFISIASNQAGKDFLSVGRVQSPTLALIVDKEKDIQSFVPESFWEIEANLEKGRKFKAKHKKGRFTEKKKAADAFDRAQKAEKGTVTKIARREKKDTPPAPYNTTAFLRDATRQRLSASRAMSIAEDLYTNGLISYPRTDNTVYPKSLDLRELLAILKDSEFRREAQDLFDIKELKPTRGKKFATDHPPIHPTGAATKKQLSRNQWKVYELITRRFFATLAGNSVSEITDARFDLNGEPFESKGLEIKVPGWRKFFPYYNPKEYVLPDMTEGETLTVQKVALRENETKPPNRYGQGTLIQEMERLGLGTKSTRHEIIKKLYQRGYVEGSPPRPTPSGTAVIEALEQYARTVTRAKMTSVLEEDMVLVAEGKKDFEDVVKESQDMLTKVFILLEENEERIGNKIKDALREQRIVGPCPKCGGELFIMRSQRGKRFVGCSNFPRCRNSFPLPQKGKFKVLDKTCEKCGSPMIRFKGRRKGMGERCINMDCEASKGK